MKKILYFIAYLIALGALMGLRYFLSIPFASDALFFLIFGVCLVLVPPLSVFRFSRFFRGFLYGFSIFSFSAGIPGAKVLGGSAASAVMLTFGLLAVSLLLVHRALPLSGTAETHLILRGMPHGRTRRKLLTKEGYAFFFLYTSPITALLSGWLLFIRGAASLPVLFSLSIFSVLFGFAGFLFYCILGGPAVRPSHYRAAKKHKVFLWIFLLLLVLIITYIYTGRYYTAPDPELLEALSVVEAVFTPALIGTFGAFGIGSILGFLLSLCCARFFYPICRGVSVFPTVLLSGILSFWVPPYLAILLSLVWYSMARVLEGRIQIRPFRQFPPQGRKKAVLWPLLFRPCLASLATLGARSLLASIVLHIAISGSFEALSSPALLFAASVIVVTGALIYGICFLVKEAKHHG